MAFDTTLLKAQAFKDDLHIWMSLIQYVILNTICHLVSILTISDADVCFFYSSLFDYKVSKVNAQWKTTGQNRN